jgi:membrane protease YdiL (CAAX protease family)
MAGLSYGLIYRRGGSLSDAVVAHATTNVVLVVVAAMTGVWDLWR